MPVDGSGRLFLLVTESFAVRALLGSLAAAALAGVAVRLGAVRSRRARRLLVLAPVLTAASAAVASVGEAYLPKIRVASPVEAGEFLDVPLLAYAVVAALLLLRRVVGLLAVRRTLRRSCPPIGYGALVPPVQRLAASMRIATPRVVLVDHCPGGAFTVGVLQPVIAVDPELVDRLDARELEGLLAHELAHICRRDALLGAVVGLFRDLTFFLPPLHVACRWLRHEQEESADELAADHTRRPVALASSILKVWDCSRGRRRLQSACAAVPVAAGAASWPLGPGTALSDAAKAVTLRVQRLIEGRPALSPWRLGAEVMLAGAVTAAAIGAALVVPSWVAAHTNATAVAFGYLSGPPVRTESPAFATFRALTPETPATARGAGAEASPAPATYEQAGCPCVETRAQLRAQQVMPPASADHRLVWSRDGMDAWQLRQPGERVAVQDTRPLWTLNDTQQQVGFFLVGATPG